MSTLSRYSEQLTRTYLDPGRVSVRSVQTPVSIRILSENQHEVKLPSGILLHMSIEEFMSYHSVHAVTLLEDFWNIYQLAITQLSNPTVIMTQRLLFEQCYKKILQYVHHDNEMKSILAIKSWALTHAGMVKRATDPDYRDAEEDNNFIKWINLLPPTEKIDYQKIRTEEYSTKRLSDAMSNLYKGLHRLVDHPDDLIKANGEPIDPNALVIINNYLNGYIHGHSAQVSNMLSDLITKDHIARNRSFLMLTGAQVLYLTQRYMLGIKEPDITKQIAYYNRVVKGIMSRLNHNQEV